MKDEIDYSVPRKERLFEQAKNALRGRCWDEDEYEELRHLLQAGRRCKNDV